MINATVDDAYREACAALGETIVAQRLTARRVDELERENAELRVLIALPDADTADDNGG